MALIPHFEKVTKNSTISHFLLMLGYKLFSFYFPLFLLEKGMSLPNIGFVYLLIYFPIALFSPMIGEISRKINSYYLIVCGIIGYGFYSLGMLLLPLSISFYLMQVVLGISASLFLVGNRVVLASSKLNKPSRSYGWFYSAPYYAAEFAPIIGAAMIFFFGFNGVFVLSIIIHLFNILFTFFSIPKNVNLKSTDSSCINSLHNFYQVVKKSLNFKIFSVLLFSLTILILGGFFQSFFLVFLKNIGWAKSEILTYSSLFSLFFLPVSLYGIKILSNENVVKNIFLGGLIFAISSIAIGLGATVIGFIGVLVVMEIGDLGSFLASSSRSGFILKTFPNFPHSSAVLDTIFSPLGIGLGSFIGGQLVQSFNYSQIFIYGGFAVLAVLVLVSLLRFSGLDRE